jgi:hypothetical protein
MRVNSVNRDRVAVGRVAGVVLLMALLIGLAALASSPLLHLRLCPNANRPDHHCAVTDFAAGLAEVPVAAALGLAVLAVVFACLPEPAICRRAASPFRLSPSRAPPSAVSLAG